MKCLIIYKARSPEFVHLKTVLTVVFPQSWSPSPVSLSEVQNLRLQPRPIELEPEVE